MDKNREENQQYSDDCFYLQFRPVSLSFEQSIMTMNKTRCEELLKKLHTMPKNKNAFLFNYRNHLLVTNVVVIHSNLYYIKSSSHSAM